MSKRPKCSFKGCNNRVMKSTHKNVLLDVCEDCFNNLYTRLGIQTKHSGYCPIKDDICEDLEACDSCPLLDVENECPYCKDRYILRNGPNCYCEEMAQFTSCLS